MTRRTRAALAAIIAAAVTAPAAAAKAPATTLTPVPGSPFSTVGSPPGEGHGPVALAFDPAGALLVTANGDGSVSEFSVGADGTLTRLPGADLGPGTGGLAAAWSPDGDVLAVSYEEPGSGAVAIYTRRADSPNLTLHQTIETSQPSSSLAFSPDGLDFAVTDGLVDGPGGPGGFSVYHVASDGTLTEAGGAYLQSNPQVVAFSPDGEQLAVAGGTSPNVSVYSVASLTPIAGSPFPIGARVSCLAYRPDGGSLAGCAPHAIRLDAVSATGTLTPRPRIPIPAHDVAWSPDSSLLAASTTSGDALFSFAGGHPTRVAGSPFPVTGTPGGLQFSPGGGYLATTDDTPELTGASSVTMDAVTSQGG